MVNSPFKVKLFSVQIVSLMAAFFCNPSFAQGDFSVIAASSIVIEDRSYEGYSAKFDYPQKQVKKGLWKYCKEFGKLVNMREYFEIVIPSSENEGNIDLKLFSTVDGDETRALVKFALDTAGLEYSSITKFQDQSKTLLRDFRISFYNNELQDKIDIATKQASKLSKKYKKIAEEGSAREKQELLEEITRLEQRIEEWRERQVSNMES